MRAGAMHLGHSDIPIVCKIMSTCDYIGINIENINAKD